MRRSLVGRRVAMEEERKKGGGKLKGVGGYGGDGEGKVQGEYGLGGDRGRYSSDVSEAYLFHNGLDDCNYHHDEDDAE